MEAGESRLYAHWEPPAPGGHELVERNKVALKGPITTPIGKGFRSVNVGLRKALDLYANVRPARPARACARATTTSTWWWCARTPRTCTRASSSRRAQRRRGANCVDRRRRRREDPPQLGYLHQADLHHRKQAHRGVRLQVRRGEWAQEGERGPQGQYHEGHRRPLPAHGRGGGQEHPDIRSRTSS